MIYSERNHPMQQKRGSIEVICGSMFSGKTEELIRRLKRAKFAKQRVEIFKPKIDTRYSEDEVVSHDRTSIRSTRLREVGIASNRGSACHGEYVPGSCTHRPYRDWETDRKSTRLNSSH